MADKEKMMKIMHNEKEYEFLPSDLSQEASAQFERANYIGSQCVQLERELMEKRFLLNNYVNFVVSELESEDDKDVDDKEKK